MKKLNTEYMSLRINVLIYTYSLFSELPFRARKRCPRLLPEGRGDPPHIHTQSVFRATRGTYPVAVGEPSGA